MGNTYAHQNKGYKHFATGFLILLLIYLMFHLFVSERSITSLISLTAQEKNLEEQYNIVTANRSELEARVARLRPGTLDRDFLQEEALRKLGQTSSEAIILLDENRS